MMKNIFFVMMQYFHVEMDIFSYRKDEFTGVYQLLKETNLSEEEFSLAQAFFDDNAPVCSSFGAWAKSQETAYFLRHIIDCNELTYFDFGAEQSFNLYWDRKEFFAFCTHYGLIQSDIKNRNITDISTPNTEPPPQIEQSLNEIIELKEKIVKLETKNNHLIAQLNDMIESGKSRRAFLNIIGAMLETVLEKNLFSSQNGFNDFLCHQYRDYTGISKSNLDSVFSNAKKSLKDLL